MKKIMLVALAAIMTISASAQIVSVSNKEISTKAPSQKVHYVQGAIGFLNLSGNGVKDAESAIGFDALWGYEKPLGYGIWWGQEIGLGTSRGSSASGSASDRYSKAEITTTYRAYSVRYTPANFGYRYRINNNWAIEAHLGIGISFDFAGGITTEVSGTSNGTSQSASASTSIWDWNDYTPFDVMLKIGAGFNYKHIGFDFSWQKGFIDHFKDSQASASNIFLGVRYVY
ncbi:MAG: outer membrane beta-barrel protein [Bacteroidaceae bacterium]|nr:outer membrane beta-barrel protein [Bacteroidaceae bacterium]